LQCRLNHSIEFSPQEEKLTTQAQRKRINHKEHEEHEGKLGEERKEKEDSPV
jgi:hypothetical protein